MQAQNTKIIEGILQLHINNKHESYLCLLNRFNKLDFPIAIINDQLDILFTNATINQLFKELEITKYDNLHQIHDCIHLLEYLRQHQKDDYPFFFSTLDGKAIGSFILSPEHFFFNNEAYHLIYTEHEKGNQRSPSIKYQSLIEQLGIGLGYYNLDGEILSYNNIAANHLGGKPEDFKGKTLSDLFPVEYAKVYRNRMKQCLQSDDSISFIDEILLPSGIKWFKSIYSKVYSKDGQLTGIQIISDDVSSLKQAEKNLLNEKDNFRTFINNTADGVAIVDENAKVSFVNNEFCKLLSIEEKDLLGVNAWDLIYSMSARPDKDDSYRDQIKSQFLQLLKSKEATNVVHNKTSILQRNKQNSIDITESVFVFPTSKGNNIGVFLRDITELKKAEKEIQSAYELLSETEKIAKSGSWTSNPKTGEGSWSKGSYAIRGASSELVGNTKNHESFMHPDDIEPYRKQFESNVKSKGAEFKQQYRLIDSLGNIKHIEAHYEIQRDEKGNAVFITGIDKDITVVIEKQHELQKAKEEYKALSDASFECIFISKKGICIGQNKTAEKTFGYSNIEAIGKPGTDWIVEEEREMIMHKMINNITKPYRARALRKDGSTFPCEIQAKTFKENGETIRITALRDISDRVKAEEALMDSEERFQLAMEASHDGLFDWNLITNEIYYSPRYKEMLGYKDDELPNNFSVWEKLTHPDDVKESWRRLEAHLKGETNRFEMVFKMKHKNGKYVNILSRANAVFNQNGKAERVVGTHLDISDNIKLQKSLEYQKNLTQQYLDVAGTMLLALDAQQNVVMINPKGCEILEYPLDEIIGKNWFDNFLPEERLDEIKNVFNTAIEGKIEFIEYYENPIIAKSGKKKIIAWHNSVIRNENGKIIRLFSSGNDITKEVENKKALEKSEKRFRDLFENSADAVALACDSRIINCNKAFLKLFEYPSKEEIIGTHPSQLSPDYQENGESSKEGVKRNNKDLYLKGFNKFEWIHRKKDGQNFPAEVLLTYLGKNPDGEDVLHAVIRDITDRKNRENEILQAKEKAEESDRLKSAFLANMSHEIRTPMNGILGFATLLKEPQLEEGELEQYVEVIERSGVRMLNIINDLIDISKIEAHQMEVRAEDTIINDQILFLKKFFLPEAEKNQIQLITHIPLTNEQSQIFTDKEKFFAILSNLTKNALKFTKKGHIEIGYQVLDEHQIEFYVKDTGIGIPIDKQSNIFERFIQAETAHNREYEGAGLGLAISKAYIEMLGGKIWIEYSNEKGTKFKFTVLKNLGKRVKKND